MDNKDQSGWMGAREFFEMVEKWEGLDKIVKELNEKTNQGNDMKDFAKEVEMPHDN